MRTRSNLNPVTTTMKHTLCLVLLLGVSCSNSKPSLDNDDLLEMNEEEFEEYFDLQLISDPDEYKRRDEALKKNEEGIKKVNEAYKKGDIPWFEALNELDDLPDDEFEEQKTGVFFEGKFYRTGLLPDLPEDRADDLSEEYFGEIRDNPELINEPASFSSRDLGK